MSTATASATTMGRTGEGGASGRKWLALAATCFGLFMALLDITIVNVALPTISKDLKASFEDLQWVINAYTIALAVFLVTVGRLGDIFGRKRMFVAGLAIFTTGSLLCALSSGISVGGLSHTTMLFVARAIQGFGGAFMLPLSLAIITATFEGHERGTAIGVWGGVTGLGTAVGPVLGGVLVEKVSWQSIFFINVPIGLIGIALTLYAVTESRDERAPRSIDFFGLLTSGAFVLCLVLALIQGNDRDKGWTSGYILTLFAISAIAMVAFVVGELRMKNPMADPRLFKIPSFTGGAIIAFTLSAGFYSLLFFLALYLQNTLGFDALNAGVRFLAISGMILIGAPIAGRLTDRIGPKPLLVVGSAGLVISVLLMTRLSPTSFAQDSWTVLLPAFILGGLASGIMNPPISTLAVGTVERRRAGMASGISGLARQLGTAFGIAFLGAILTSRYNSSIHDRVLAAQGPAWAHVPAMARQGIVTGIQTAGTTAGSLGLPAGPQNPYSASPLRPALGEIARSAFVSGTIDIFRIAAALVAVGLLAALFLVRRSDLQQSGHGQPPAAAH